jgi:hypothetical protein
MVVTADDAGAALGEPVGPAKPLIEQPLPVGLMRGCQYAAVSGERASVSVFIAAGRRSRCWRGRIAASARPSPASATRPGSAATLSRSSGGK